MDSCSSQVAALQPAADGAAAPKRKGKGPVGPVLGRGSAVVRAVVDAAAAGTAEGSVVAELADRQSPSCCRWKAGSPAKTCSTPAALLAKAPCEQPADKYCTSDIPSMACRMATLSMPAASNAVQPTANGGDEGSIQEALQRVAAALDPSQPQLRSNLATLRATLEANQVWKLVQKRWVALYRYCKVQHICMQ